MKRSVQWVLAVVALSLSFALSVGIANAETVDLVNSDYSSGWSDGESGDSDISADGQLVVFESDATDLDFLVRIMDSDTNDAQDVFVYDRVSKHTEVVSTTSTSGSPGNGASSEPSISPDGRYVAFQSLATDLVTGDGNGYVDIFVRDLVSDQTVLMSRNTDGTQGNGDSTNPSVTADEERVYVAYESVASNLVTGPNVQDNDQNGATRDVFVSYFWKSDPSSVTTELVSRRTNGSQGTNVAGCGNPSISGDGQYVAYESGQWLEHDGGYTDSDFETDVYVTDWDKDDTMGHVVTRHVSVQTGGDETTDEGCENPDISSDGKYVVYDSASKGLTGDSDSYTDVFRTDWNHDAADMVTVKVSPDKDGSEGNGGSEYASINADGRYVAFESDASDLVKGDENGLRDIFVRDLGTGTTHLVSNDFFGGASNGASGEHGASAGPAITAALGDVAPEVSFFSLATNLIWGFEESPDAGYKDVFVATTDTTPRIDEVMPGLGPDSGRNGVWIVGANFLDAWSSWNSAYWGDPDSTDPVVYFGDEPAADWYWHSPQVLWAEAPAHAAGMVQVKVVAGGGETADTPSDDYTYVATLLPGMIVHSPRAYVRYEQDDVQIVYKGEWTSADNEEFSAKVSTQADDAEASITITFTGTQLDWIASLGPTMGKALVSVDGGEAVLVDLHNETELFQQMVWSTGLLAYGEHTVVVTFPEGEDYVVGKAINIDAVDVYGAFPSPIQEMLPNRDFLDYMECYYGTHDGPLFIYKIDVVDSEGP